MKVLGLNFGRKRGNTVAAVSEALLGAHDAGAEIQLLHMMDLRIDPCKACFGCLRMGKCILKDDLPAVEELILDADALIVGAPVFSVGPTGKMKCLIDRMGLAHDRAFAENARQRAEAEGQPGPDPRLFKDRYMGLISVGGATDGGWTAMGLPNMSLFSFSMQMPVVDQYDLHDMNVRGSIVLHEDVMARLNNLGRRVAEAVGAEDKYSQWRGEEPGVCPACHNSLLTIGQGTDVSCPICGMRGKLAVVDGQIKVDFPESEFEHSRMRFGGLQEHMVELMSVPQRMPKSTRVRMPEIEGLLKARYADIPEVKAK